MRIQKLFLAIIIVVTSCNSKYKTLSVYYKNNIALHNDMAIQMKHIFKRYDVQILIKKNNSLNQIEFMYLVKNENTYRVKYFDNSYNIIKETKNNSESNIEVPLDLLRKLSNSIYHAIKTDSNGVFFAYQYSNSMSEYEVGIFTPLDSLKDIHVNIIRKLPNNFYISKSIVP